MIILKLTEVSAMEDYEKEREERQFRKSILEAILVSSITPENARLPTINEYILSEIVNGVVDYTGGRAGKITYSDDGFEDNTYIRHMQEYFREEMTNPHTALTPRIKSDLEKMLAFTFAPYDRGEGYYPVSELYEFFNSPFIGICQAGAHSIFSLPYDLVMKVRNKTLPSLSEEEQKDILGIGKCMRKYIDEDMKDIGKTYHW
jgi:hypothetical protein